MAHAMSAEERGYPSRWCPTCGNEAVMQSLINPARTFGPGELAIYQCVECHGYFAGVVPEPPDDYEGDGVFAENH